MRRILEGIKLATPILVILLTFYINTVKTDIRDNKISLTGLRSEMQASMGGIKCDIEAVRTDMNHHFQNSELHVPRATIVSKDEFTIYQAMRDREMATLKESIYHIENMMEKHMEKSQ